MTEGKHRARKNDHWWHVRWLVIGPEGEAVCETRAKHLAEIIAEALDRYRAEIDERLQP